MGGSAYRGRRGVDFGPFTESATDKNEVRVSKSPCGQGGLCSGYGSHQGRGNGKVAEQRGHDDQSYHAKGGVGSTGSGFVLQAGGRINRIKADTRQEDHVGEEEDGGTRGALCSTGQGGSDGPMCAGSNQVEARGEEGVPGNGSDCVGGEESVDSFCLGQTSSSEFLDDRSSKEGTKIQEGFIGGDGCLENLFAISGEEREYKVSKAYSFSNEDIPGEVPGMEITNAGDEAHISVPDVKYYTRRVRKRRGQGVGLPKQFLNKMDISLLPLKRNLAPRRRGTTARTNCETGRKGKRRTELEWNATREYYSN